MPTPLEVAVAVEAAATPDAPPRLWQETRASAVLIACTVLLPSGLTGAVVALLKLW